MKKLICLLALILLPACGSGVPEPATQPAIPAPLPVVQSSSPPVQSALPAALEARFEQVKTCVKENYVGPLQDGVPVVVSEPGDTFQCRGDAVWGCTDNKTIWIASARLEPSLFDHDWVFAHESIHWLTGIGDEGHGTPLFLTCIK